MVFSEPMQPCCYIVHRLWVVFPHGASRIDSRDSARVQTLIHGGTFPIADIQCVYHNCFIINAFCGVFP